MIIVKVMNLDPAADVLPYMPDFDIRKYVNAKKIAIEEGLGPNGALIKAMEKVTKRLDLLISFISNVSRDGVDYILIDTPGQMEVFLFRDISWRLSNSLKEVSKDVYALFVIDASILKRAVDYAFASLLAIATQLRLNIETVPIVNKIDLVPALEVHGDFLRDLSIIERELASDGTSYAEMLKDISKILLMYSKGIEVPKVSAIKGIGIDELHRLVHELSCTCGDLT